MSGAGTAVEVKKVEDWSAALAVVDRFHDAVTRSVMFENDQRVDERGAMEMTRGRAALRVVVQTQSRDHPAAELTFAGVASFSFDRNRGAEPGDVAPVTDARTGEALLRFEFLECEVLARSATVRPLDWRSSEHALDVP